MVRNCALAARGGMAVTMTQKIVLIALLVLGGLCLIVGFTLMHHIGGLTVFRQPKNLSVFN